MRLPQRRRFLVLLPAMAEMAAYLKDVLAAREVLAHTLLDGECLGSHGFRADDSVRVGVFCNGSSGLRTAVLVNPHAEAITTEVAGFIMPRSKPLRLWQPAKGFRRVELPARVEIPGRRLALITEEAVP